jgi:rhomboid family GlyGly-CTERM serine protease
MDRQKRIGVQGLIPTLFIVGLAIILYSFPKLSNLFVYDRREILNGELWRILTAPLVHFSASHIFWDILIFGIAGFAIQMSGFPCFWIVCGFTAFIPGIIFLVAFPDLEYYGGLSGLATGAAAYFCLCRLFGKRKERFIWLFILVFMGIKILVEATMDVSIFAQADSIPFRVLPSVHIVGYLGALAATMWTWLRNSPYSIKNRRKM